MFGYIKRYRRFITILLACTGIGLMMYYDYCDKACSYVKGNIWGVDLKWIGIAFMTVIIILMFLRQSSLVRFLLAGALGVEVYLFAFQIQHEVCCTFCLAFSTTVIAMFAVNYELPSVWKENRRKMWLYFLGDASFPMFKVYKLPLLIVGILGYLFVVFTFSGSVVPTYSQDKIHDMPFLESGEGENVLFSDYLTGINILS